MGGEVVFHFFGGGCGYCYTIGLRDALHLKMAVFLTFSLPKFSIASVFTALVNNFLLTVQQFEVLTVMAWKLASNWAILKVDEGLNIWEKCISVKQGTDRWKLSKILFLGSNTLIWYFCWKKVFHPQKTLESMQYKLFKNV